MKDILNSYLYSNCAIQDMDNKLLMWGEVEAVTDELAMDIAPGEDCLVPHMLHGTPVRAVLRNRSKILILDCTICGFNGTVLRVENIEKIQDTERRNYFRINTAAEGRVCKFRREKGDDIYSAKLKDISLSGARFVSEGDFSEEQEVRLYDFTLTNELNPYDLEGVILSKDEEGEGEFLYRCKFEELDYASSDHLCKAIFTLQREQKRERRGRSW